MKLCPRQIFIDLIHDLQDLSMMLSSHSEIKDFSTININVLDSLLRNLILSINMGYTIESLTSTRLHSYLSLLLEMSADILSDNSESYKLSDLESFLERVLNIFRWMFKLGFYGNCKFSNSRESTQIRNSLLCSVQITLINENYKNLYEKYILPIFFNFLFFTTDIVENTSIESYENHIENKNEEIDNANQKTVYNDLSKDFVQESILLKDDSELIPLPLYTPLQLRSIILKQLRSSFTFNGSMKSVDELFLESHLTKDLCNDLYFIEYSRTKIYCENLYDILISCPQKVRDLIAQHF